MSGTVIELVGVPGSAIETTARSVGETIGPGAVAIVEIAEGLSAIQPLVAGSCVGVEPLIPVGVGAKISRDVIALVDGVIEVTTEIGVDGTVVAYGGITFLAYSVAIGVEHDGGAVAMHVPAVIANVGIDVKVDFLVGEDVGYPWSNLRPAGGVKTKADELVALDSIVGDDVHHRGAAAIAGAGVGDNLYFLYTVGGEGTDILLEALTTHVAGLIINPNIDTLGAAEGDIAVSIHLHTGGVL